MAESIQTNFLDGTYFKVNGQVPVITEVKALCPDGKVRSVQRLFVSGGKVGGSVKIQGKTRSGQIVVGQNTVHFVVKNQLQDNSQKVEILSNLGQ